MEEDSSEVEESPVFALLELRRRADSLLLQQAKASPHCQQLLAHKEQELALAHTALADLQNREIGEVSQAQRLQGSLQTQLEAKDTALTQAQSQIQTLQTENQRLAAELDRAHQAISDLVAQTQTLERKHNKELAEARLKHEQELYILRKLSR